MIRRVLLVDDDPLLLRVLTAALTEEGFEVHTAGDGLTGLARFQSLTPDLVILDVLLPELDGLALCRKIRALAPTPVFLLTSRGEEVDRVNGLDTGADDYITKPFSTRELCARIRAVDRLLARTAPSAGTLHTSPGRGEGVSVRVGDLVLDTARFEVRWKGTVVPFTRAEFTMLRALARSHGTALARDRLLELAREDDTAVTDRSVDSLIKRIRQKLRAADASFDAIETVFGVGYRYKS